MQFLAELLEKKWRENEIKMILFYHNSNLFHKDGKLINHKMKDNFFTKDELFLMWMMVLFLFYRDQVLYKALKYLLKKLVGYV